MKRLFYSLFLIICSSSLFAQGGRPGGGGGGGNRGGGNERPTRAESTELNLEGDFPKGNVKISGIVTDESLKSAVEYATIALWSKKINKPVDGTIADENGKFSIKKVAEGKYKLIISFIGFEPTTIDNIDVKKDGDVDLGVIKLKVKTNLLNEVVVSAEASLIEEKVDRLVYNAEKDLNARGGDAADVLKNVPMLDVDLDGNVSLRGSGNIRVLINNRPSTIVASSIADALKMIPADLIKTVEVITSPSAKYDAEGTAGIINIITKRATLKGLNLNLDAGVGLRGSNLGFNGTYRRGIMGVSLSGYGRNAYNNRNTTESDQTTYSNNQNTIQFSDGTRGYLFGRYNLGLDFEISKSQYLTTGVSFGTRNSNMDQSLKSDVFLNESLLRSTTRDVKSVDNSGTTDFNLDYIKIFKPGRELSFSSQYSFSDLINNYNANLLGSDNQISSRQQNLNNSINKELTFQTDYVTAIGARQQFETGLKMVRRIVDSEFEYKTAIGSNAFALDVLNPSGILNYNQDVYAAYVSYLVTTKNKYTFKIGARLEDTEIAAVSQKKDVVIPSYINLVPSVNISKKINQTTYKIGFNRRIQRPGLEQLNPNVNLSNPLNITVGNPFLNPEISSNLEFSFSKNIKKTYINFSFFGRQTSNAINRISTPSDSIPGAIVTTYQNIGIEKTAGTNVYGNVFLTPKWTLNGGVDVYYQFIEGTITGLNNLSETLSNDGVVVGGRISSSLTLKDGWGIQASGGMRGRSVSLQGWQGGRGRYSLGFRKDFNQKKTSFGLSADNFFGGIRNLSFVDGPLLTRTSNNFSYNSNVRFTFSHKIGNMKFVERKKTKKVSNDDVLGGSTED